MGAEPTDPRLLALRRALDTAGVDALHAAASALGGNTGAWLRSVVDAAQRGDELGLQGLLEGAPQAGFTTVARAALERMAAVLQAAAERAEAALSSLRHLPALRAAVDAAQGRVAADAELSGLVGRAGALLAKLEGQLSATRDLPDALRALAAEVRQVDDGPAVSRAVEGLEQRLRLLEQAVPELRDAVQLAWDISRRAQGARGLWEVALAAEQAGVEGDWWEQVMALALEEGDLELARRAGQRAQVAAMSRGDLPRVGQLSARLEAAVGATPDRRAVLLLRLEQLLVQARTGDAARAARQAAALAEAEDGALRARAWLVAGQIAALAGRPGEARRAWRRVLEGAVEQWPEEAVRAHLEMVRQIVDQEPERALTEVEAARDLALRARHAPGFALALAARLVLQPDDDTVRAWLRAAQAALGEAWPALRAWLLEAHPTDAPRWLADLL